MFININENLPPENKFEPNQKEWPSAGLSLLGAHLLESSFKNIHEHVGVLLGKGERWADANGGSAARADHSACTQSGVFVPIIDY